MNDDFVIVYKEGHQGQIMCLTHQFYTKDAPPKTWYARVYKVYML